MGAPQPQFIPEAFAIAAAGPDRNAIPAAPIGLQRASFDLGFPPQTMTPIVAGGKPMLGPDMNGILYMMSSHNVYTQSGQPYRWNADVVVAIGGYAAGTILGSTDSGSPGGSTVWFNLLDGNTTDPDDPAASDWVPLFSYGFSLLPATMGGVVTLTVAQAKRNVIVISGALVANLQVVFPTSLRRWLVVNNTSGGFTTTVRTPAGLGIQVSQGGYAGPTEVYGDGVNLYNVVSPTVLPTDVAPTPNTIALRSNLGYLYATYFNQSSALENFGINEVYAGAGDGFLRKINKANFAANFPLTGFAGQIADAQIGVTSVNQYRATILANSVLTGTPQAPTPVAGDNSTKVATTAFVHGVANLVANGSAVLPNGLILKWGTSATAVTAFSDGAFPTACFGVLLLNINTTDQIYRTALTLANFTVNNPGLKSFFWAALGK